MSEMTSCTLPTLPSTASTVRPSRSARSAPTSSRKVQRSVMRPDYPHSAPILGRHADLRVSLRERAPLRGDAADLGPADYGTARRKREMDKSASDGADKHDSKQAEKKTSSESKPAADSKPAPSKSSDS